MTVIGPVALHAGFDFPLLMLQKYGNLDPTLRLWLGAASVLIGFSSIGFAVRLVRRVARYGQGFLPHLNPQGTWAQVASETSRIKQAMRGAGGA